MPGIDESRDFIPVRIAVLTVSDSRTPATDRSGPVLIERLETAGHILADRAILPDDEDALLDRIGRWIEDPEIDVVLTTGGTGLTARDITPEVFERLYDKAIPGFGELFRQLSYTIIGTSTIQSRATAGVSGGTYLFALPGSPSAVRDAWDGILLTQLDHRYRPCNFVEIMPRLAGRIPKGRSN
jgi:molybdenum cofactor biosynthesis protein B